MSDPKDLIVIGIDPGASTGLAIIKNEHRLAAQQAAPADVMRTYRAALASWHDVPNLRVHVACERFTAGQRSVRHTHQSDPYEVIGAVKGLASELGYAFELQSPGDAKRIASNATLRCLGLYTTARSVACPDSDDVNDAMRHAILLLARRYASRFDDLIARECVDPVLRSHDHVDAIT